MLFNSPAFLFVFLPATLVGFFLLGGVAPYLAALWAVAASLVFYAWDDPWRLLPLISASIAFNYLVGIALGRWRSRSLLVIGVAGNLALLGYFKYAGFFTHTLARLGAPITPLSIALPIGISFFTFTQVAFLVDTYRREAQEYRPIHYALFVTFFPHLVAGPILHHKEIIPQFDRSRTYRFDAELVALGLTWFAAGLFKKVMIADVLAPYATMVFDAAGGTVPSFADAWLATISYSLQLYFDFSGYSDMAIGLAMIMGVQFPLNFHSPYKATSLIDFWRRWHMTLSRFLRDYLYFPLGGSRHGSVRRYVNLLITMLLGGLWHGAAWKFVLWGGLHGAGLCINHLWHDRVRMRVPWPIARILTLVFVILAWVPFRAPTLRSAASVWAAMFGLTSASHNPSLDATGWLFACLFGGIALGAPNTNQLLDRNRWEPKPIWAAAFGAALGVAVAACFLQRSAFLYFRF